MKRWMIGIGVFLLVAGVAYFSTLGCCQFMSRRQEFSLLASLQLSADQKQKAASLDREFLATKHQVCGRLCAKRAQLIQMLKTKEPADSPAFQEVVEEIGREQIALEKATLAHVAALRNILEPAQADRLTQRLTEELRSACGMTACGATPGCFVTEKK